MLTSRQTALRLSLAAACALGTGVPFAWADTLTVGMDPLTADFISIQDAVDAAAAGDTILVGPGEYVGFRVNTKHLTILGAGQGLSRIYKFPGSFFSEGSAIRAEFVDTGRTRIGGFLIELGEHEFPTGIAPRWVSLWECNAPVELFDIEVRNPDTAFWDYFTFGPNNPVQSGYVDIADCRRVLLSDVRVTGTAQQALADPMGGDSGINTVEGYAGLALHDSLAWTANCHFEGCPLEHCFGDNPPLAPVRSGPGAHLWNSRLIASNTYFEGGRGQTELSAGCVSMEGGAGIVLKYGSQAELLGGPSAEVQGGSSLGSAAGGSGALLYGPSSLLYAADTTPIGGFAGSGLIAPSIDELTPELVQVLVLDEQRPSLVPSTSFADQGSTIQLTLAGTANATQVVLWDAELTGSLDSPLLVGDLFLDPVAAQMLGVFALDGAGQAATSIEVPVGAEFAGISIAMQAVELAHPLFYPAPPIFLATSH